ncbi:hypothetical protein PHLCEN_2v8576 [Hermanssonia centrifuga]|uniref:Uncharacterized protein n=1 Tax=Hermanssonia centrifuga TaxID=98765 RepID=A0A2R6NT86_9APHY|nr:hypothetical protein PHLCEN_2v8576 [Hermanssonia centrifuga]
MQMSLVKQWNPSKEQAKHIIKNHKDLQMKIYMVNQVVRQQVDTWIGKKYSDIKSYFYKKKLLSIDTVYM